MDQCETLKSFHNQKTKSKKLHHTKSKPIPLKTDPLCNKQKDNYLNSISEPLRQLNINKGVWRRNQTKSDKSSKIYGEKHKKIIRDIPNSNCQTDLSILPSSQDLNEIPELPPNIVSGSYESPSQYLNLHFKLLKEDFVSNLRSGFQEYKTNLKGKSSSRIKDVFVYDAVYLGIMQRSQKTNLTISFEVDNKKLKNVDWDTSKRLMNGSLLLISNDNFETYYLNLVDERTPPKNGDKTFIISALVVDKLIKFKSYTKCVIIEPNVFFTPYFQVLKTIKTIEPNIFPMEKYIVRVNTHINPPAYINKETRYLVKGNKINPYDITSYGYPEIFALNKFQISALQAALNKQFVLIQGPPGTGKSHLGLKIINILLDNKLVWQTNKSPILVVCYRNNAVDQILESLIKSGREIVRLGNQSNSNLVKVRCLRNAVQNINGRPEIRDQINTIKNQTETLKSQIIEMQTVVDSIAHKRGVLNINSLSEVVTVCQRQYLSVSNIFEEWLFGGYHESDSNEVLLDGLISDPESNRSLKSFFLISIPDLIKELSDFHRTFDDLQLEGRDLSDFPEMVQKYEQKKLFLRKIVNRMNLDTDGLIDIAYLDFNDLSKLSIPERWKLYKHWEDAFCNQCTEKIEECFIQVKEKLITLDELYDINNGYRLLQLCPDVVGATTTGAACMHSLLKIIKPKIVIFEEAAEFLEIHTVTALTEFCEHIIMIGDHQQLRPNPASHLSVIKYQLDISLFERMIKNGIEYFTLNEQHRMRPLISSLVVPLFYPDLRNHPSVENYPDVRGLRENMFFLDHSIPEEELVDNESHQNKHEANFILALADYLLKQGYDAKDITVLTLYGAQLSYLKSIHSKYPALKNVSMEVVDNFQGEENKIILLSLVRSNSYSIGFLSKKNRICVALTRAKEGFYMIGNMTTLKRKSSVWEGINGTLKRNKTIGNRLPLKCRTHGTITNVETAADFLSLRFGGCTKICGVRLECDHICELQCHGSDEGHLGTFSCQKPCERKLGCKIHDCKAACGEPCPKCDAIVKTVLPSGQLVSKKCEGGLV